MADPASRPILFFDGVCNLCNGFVDFLVRRHCPLLLASLQGETAIRRLDPGLRTSLSSVVLVDGVRVYTKSSAALRALVSLGGVWQLLKLFLLIPSFFRDPVYMFVASHRYEWFGKRGSCRLPEAKEKEFFLP